MYCALCIAIGSKAVMWLPFGLRGVCLGLERTARSTAVLRSEDEAIAIMTFAVGNTIGIGG